MGLDNLFDEVVLLNLDKRINNQKRIEADIRRLGFKGEFSPFVVGKGKILPQEEYDMIDAENVSAIWDAGPYRNLKNSFFAFRAFQTIIARMKSKGNRSVLLLEDDAIFTDNFSEVLFKAEAGLKEESIDWDLLFLGGNHAWARTEDVNDNLLAVDGTLCWHGIGLSESTYDTILSWTPDMPIDLKAAQELHPVFDCYSVWPSIILQEPGVSSVEGKFRDYSEFWSSKGRNSKCV
jgi:hypothetical protein